MRVILRLDITGVSEEGFVKLYRACKEFRALVKHVDPASNAFHVYVRFSDFHEDENTLNNVEKLLERINQASSYCEVLATAIIPHESLLHSKETAGHGCPKEIEGYLRKVCTKYVRSMHEGRGMLEVSGTPVLVICRRRVTQILLIEGRADTYSLTSPPTPTRVMCVDMKKLKEILKQLKEAVSLLRQHLV